LEASCGLSHRAGKCASFVAKEFAFKQPARDRCAVNCHEAILASSASLMNCLRDYLFTGAGLALNQDGGVYRRNHVDPVEYSPKFCAASYQFKRRHRSSPGRLEL
jgi:hypothetical protein